MPLVSWELTSDKAHFIHFIELLKALLLWLLEVETNFLSAPESLNFKFYFKNGLLNKDELIRWKTSSVTPSSAGSNLVLLAHELYKSIYLVL